jgi:bla regulator protein BlaR1
MIAYLIKSTCCSAIFLLAYLLVMEREKMHRFNRWYLLGSILLSFIIPLLSVPGIQPVLPVLIEPAVANWDISVVSPGQEGIIGLQSPANHWTISGWWLLYSFVGGLLVLRLLHNLYKLSKAILNKPTVCYKGARIILLEENAGSFSFLNTIFISNADYDAHQETKVLTHELAHVKQKHSLDILFIEIIKTACWFNPLFILYKKAIQANHEYLADDAVLAVHPDVASYQYLLLEKASTHSPFALSSNLTYSDLKKRLVMITQQKNPWSAFAKKLSTLPLLATALIAFGSGIAAIKTSEPVQQAVVTKDTTPPRLYRPSQLDLPVTNPAGVSKEELDAFNGIVARNTVKNKAGQDVITHVSPGDRNRLEEIYKRMNLQQRGEAKVAFGPKIQPPAKKIPTEAQLEKWKNPADYGVWIDDHKVANASLNDYKASDFSHYDASNLAYTEKMKQDVMARFHLKVMYKVQLNLMTNEHYEKYVALSNAQPENTMYYHITRSPNGRRIEALMPIN